jgi:hypothetical protein
MSDLHDTDEVRAVLDPVWFNTYWVENALGLYEGVSKHADELNTNHNTFFALVQKFSLDSAVIGICKLYDISNPTYQKDTVPALLDYLREHITNSHVFRLKSETLTALGTPQQGAMELAEKLKTSFDKTKTEFIAALERLLPTRDNDAALSRLLTYRNKIGAYQERLSDALNDELRSLPSLHDMERLNKWSINFCTLCISLLTPNVTLLQNGRSSRIAALNVAVKVLDKKFDTLADERAFFSRI